MAVTNITLVHGSANLTLNRAKLSDTCIPVNEYFDFSGAISDVFFSFYLGTDAVFPLTLLNLREFNGSFILKLK